MIAAHPKPLPSKVARVATVWVVNSDAQVRQVVVRFRTTHST